MLAGGADLAAYGLILWKFNQIGDCVALHTIQPYTNASLNRD